MAQRARPSGIARRWFSLVRSAAACWLLAALSVGAQTWTHRFGHGGARDVVAGPGDTLVVAGSVDQPGSLGEDACIVKLDRDGLLEWQLVLGRDAGSDHFSSILPMPGGGYLAGGHSRLGPGVTEIWLVRLSEDGEVLWQRSYGRGFGGVFLAAAPDGEVFVSSFASVSGRLHHAVLKLSPAGDLLWARRFRQGLGTSTNENGIVALPDGSVVVGTFYFREDVLDDGLLVSFDSDGNLLWNLVYGFPGDGPDERFTDLALLPDGGLLALGRSSLASDRGVFALRLDAARNELWQRRYSTPESDWPWFLVSASDGCAEGPAGFDSTGAPRESRGTWTPCGP